MSILNKFKQDYIETALWSSTDDNDVPLDDNYSVDDIDQESRDKMNRDCIDFIEIANNFMHETDHAGHDFWLTRNGHGAGFWDGNYPLEGERLTEISKSFSHCDLYVGDDDKLYIL